MTDVEIRRIDTEDLTDCVELFCEVYREPPYHETWSGEQAASYLDRFLDMDPNHSFVACDSEGVGGVVIGYTYPWKDGVTYHIQEIFVRASARRKGIAKALVGHAVASLRAERDVSVTLIANQMSPAARFYEHLGLSQHPVYKFYTGRLPG